MIKIISAGVAAAFFFMTAAPAAAVDGMAVEAGAGDGKSEGTDVGQVAVQWSWSRRWLQGGDWHVGGYWDLGLGHWRRGVTAGQNGSITEIGATPVFRLHRNSLSGFYLEAGIGLHLLSKSSLGEKQFSTLFQFGDHLGFGYRFGARDALDLAYRYQHLSNADIKKPNDGIEFHQIRLQYHF